MITKFIRRVLCVLTTMLIFSCGQNHGNTGEVTSLPKIAEHPFDSLRASCPTELVQFTYGKRVCVTCDSGGRWEIQLFPRTLSSDSVQRNKLLKRDARYIVTNYDMWMLERKCKPFELQTDNNEEDSKEELDMPFLSRAYRWQDSVWTQVSTAMISSYDEFHCFRTAVTEGRYRTRLLCDTIVKRP